jgi:hypothetical protein
MSAAVGNVSGSAQLHFFACPEGFCCESAESCSAQRFTGGCAAGSNRAGALCGQCAEGHGLQLFSSACRTTDKCNDAAWAAVLLAVAVAAYAAFLVRPVPQVSVLPPGLFAAVLFFYQALALVRDPASWTHSEGVVVHLLLTLFTASPSSGGGGVCVVPQMGARAKLAAGFFVPLFVGGALVLWTAARRSRAWWARRRARSELVAPPPVGELAGPDTDLAADDAGAIPQRWVPGRTALIRFTLLAYSGVVATSLKLLSCRRVLGHLVFFSDAELPCYRAWQAPYFLLAIAAAALPVVLIVWSRSARRAGCSSRAAPALAVLEGPFRPTHRHWNAVLLYVRLLLAALFAFVADALWRALLLASVCLVLLVMSVRLAPFAHSRTNSVNTALLTLLAFVALLAVPPAARTSVGSSQLLGHSATTGDALEGLQFVLAVLPAAVGAGVAMCRGWRVRRALLAAVRRGFQHVLRRASSRSSGQEMSALPPAPTSEDV